MMNVNEWGRFSVQCRLHYILHIAAPLDRERIAELFDHGIFVFESLYDRESAEYIHLPRLFMDRRGRRIPKPQFWYEQLLEIYISRWFNPQEIIDQYPIFQSVVKSHAKELYLQSPLSAHELREMMQRQNALHRYRQW